VPLAELWARVETGLTDFELYAAERRPRTGVARVKEAVKNAAIGLGFTQLLGRRLQFESRGYKIPLDLAIMTGAGAETWEEIARGHMRQFDAWAPIAPQHAVLEIGCGIGRDAMALAERLSPSGAYVGLDVVRPSIAWCQRNITPRYPRFTFHHLDVRSDMYNPGGSCSNRTVSFPVVQGAFDRVFLHSVFTHMLRDDVGHYLDEIRKALAPSGVVLASVFVMDDASLASASGELTFRHAHAGADRINDAQHPEAAVGYRLETLEALVRRARLKLVELHRGSWSGLHPDALSGQDILLLSHA